MLKSRQNRICRGQHGYLRVLVACIALSLGVATGIARADDHDPTLMIVLDGSGSMWGKLSDGTDTKLALSQQFLIDSLKSARPNLKLGFASFGHRRAGNCADAQVIVAPNPGSAKNIIAHIEKHNPRGKGPLSLALRRAAEAISPKAQSAIVLIHDGYDNCRQNPCDVANEISKSHPNLKIHTIGLDLPRSALNAMSCVAKKTGGTMRLAKNATALKSAVEDALALTALRPPEKIARATTNATRANADKNALNSGPPRIRISASFKTDTNQLLRDVDWQVVSEKNPNDVRLERRATELTALLPAGDYLVRARAGLAKTDQKISVKEKGETHQTLRLDAGMIAFERGAPQTAAEGPSKPAFISIRSKDNAPSKEYARPTWIGTDKGTAPLVVPSGSYDIEIARGSTQKNMTATVAAGKITKVNTLLSDGVLVLDSTIAASDVPDTDAAGPSARPQEISYIISVDDPSYPGGRREIARSAAGHAEFSLSPGTVYVEARIGHAQRQRRLAIGSGQIVRHQFEFDLANVTLAAMIGDQPIPTSTPIQFTVFALSSGRPKRLTSVSKQNPSLVLPSGRYRFEANVAGKLIGKSKDIEIFAKTRPTTVTVPLNAGQLTLENERSTSQASLPRYQIRNTSTDEIVWRGRVTQSKTTLVPPGHYILETRGTPKRPPQTFAVELGQTTVIRVRSQL